MIAENRLAQLVVPQNGAHQKKPPGLSVVELPGNSLLKQRQIVDDRYEYDTPIHRKICMHRHVAKTDDFLPGILETCARVTSDSRPAASPMIESFCNTALWTSSSATKRASSMPAVNRSIASTASRMSARNSRSFRMYDFGLAQYLVADMAVEAIPREQVHRTTEQSGQLVAHSL